MFFCLFCLFACLNIHRLNRLGKVSARTIRKNQANYLEEAPVCHLVIPEVLVINFFLLVLVIIY